MYAVKNKVQLIGNLGAKPEIRSMDSGRKLAILRLATNETYRNATGEVVQNTQWHRVIAWGKIVDVIERFCDKGKELLIEGKLVNRHYNDKNGNKKVVTEVQANEILMLGSKVVH